ncbi:MAG: hypothetical protein LBQ88_02185 [Treponema sp.]|nr:hypothetical protein [Treponema sp.]
MPVSHPTNTIPNTSAMTNITTQKPFIFFFQLLLLVIQLSKLAEKVNTSAHYIGMIEMERIAAALEIDSPELFSMKAFPLEYIKKYQELVLADVEAAISGRIKELEQNLGNVLGACGTLVNFCIFMQKFRLMGLLWEFARYKYS